jgi:hypothetical protein
MKAVHQRVARWAGAACFVLALAACGGGGGGSSSPPGDARNGAYTMLAADARDYVLTLNFDVATYQVTGNGVDQSGRFTAAGEAFLFEPGNASGSSGSSTTRFAMVTDAVVGEFALPTGTVPFIAPRRFVTTVAGAAGTYDFLGRTVDTSGAPVDTTIQQAEITAGGELRICEDNVIFPIATCPLASVRTGSLTVDGNVFTAATTAGNVPFRVAQIGTDKLFVRASASVAPTRRFIVGTPAVTTFTGGTFLGGTTEPAWGTVTLSSTAFSSTGTTPSGATSTMTGTSAAAGAIEGIRGITTASAGNYFAIRSSEIGVVLAARGNVVAPAFMGLGKKQ